jgi:hypothetical protein
MADVLSDTHAMAVAGAGSAAAGEAVITGAPIVMPAGGPFTIFKIWGAMVQATAAAAESYGGYMRLESASGDITPNPAPSRFPVGMIGSSLGATIDVGVNPIAIHDVNYEVAGKANVNLIMSTPTVLAVAPQCVMGIIFGKTRPELKPFIFCDYVRAQIAAVALTAVGTITIPEKASKIVAVAGLLAHDNVLVAGEELLGYFSMASDDVKLPPAQFPFNAAYSAGLGALINNVAKVNPLWIPVEIPIVNGARIDVSCKLNTAVTNAAEVQVYIAFE